MITFPSCEWQKKEPLSQAVSDENWALLPHGRPWRGGSPWCRPALWFVEKKIWMGERCTSLSPRTARRKDSPKLNTPPPPPPPYICIWTISNPTWTPETQSETLRRLQNITVQTVWRPYDPITRSGPSLDKKTRDGRSALWGKGVPRPALWNTLAAPPAKTVKTVGRWLGKIKRSHDKTIWQHGTMIMVIIITHLLLYTSKLLKYTCWVYNV